MRICKNPHDPPDTQAASTPERFKTNFVQINAPAQVSPSSRVNMHSGCHILLDLSTRNKHEMNVQKIICGRIDPFPPDYRLL
jgi:hypothetical protein